MRLDILLIEDDSALLPALHRALAEEDLEVRVRQVNDFSALKAALQNRTFDLILSEYHFSQLDFYQIFAYIKQRYPRLPFVILAQAINMDVAMKLVRGGVDDFIMKENIKRLGYTLKQVLHSYQLRFERQQQDLQLRKMFELAFDAIFIIDEKGLIQEVNPSACQMFGYSKQELLGRNISILMDSPHRENHDGYLQHYLQTGQHRIIGVAGRVMQARRKDGTLFWHELAVTEVLLEGRRSFVGFLKDISAQIEAQKSLDDSLRLNAELQNERHLREIKSRFISMVTHDFRNPLAAIQVAADLLAHPDLPTERRREKHANISEQIKRLNELIEDILVLGQMENENDTPTLEEVDVVALCRNIYDENYERFSQKHPFLWASAVEKVWAVLQPSLVRRAVLNLFSNAAKYSPPQHPIQLGIEVLNEMVIISVEDQGIGIPTEEQKSLFQPFFRASNVASYSGTGLGLAMVKETANLHGGTVVLNSQEGLGTRVELHLPIHKKQA